MMAPVGGNTGDPRDGSIAVISTGAVGVDGAHQPAAVPVEVDKRRINRMFSWTADSPVVT